MKITLTLMLLFVAVASLAQLPELPMKDGAVVYAEEVTAGKEYNKETLFRSSTEWFRTVFANHASVADIRDENAGKLSGKGVFEFTTKTAISEKTHHLTFTVTIASQDGKYSYRIGDIYLTDDLKSTDADKALTALYTELTAGSLSGKKKKLQEERIADVHEQISIIVSELKNAMTVQYKW